MNNGIGNYDYLKTKQGLKAVNRSTGEVTDAVERKFPVGSTVITPERKKAYNQYTAKNETKRVINSVLGHFFFIPRDEDFADLLPQTVTRLIYLNTFIDYDTNRLMLSQRTPMRRADLVEVLGISKAAVSQFWKTTSPKYIKETEDGLMFTNRNVFVKRKLQKNTYNPMMKFYINGIRTLYRSTDISNHKHLGYVFKMLPFVNTEYNILCHNPDESDLHSIRSLSFGEFCESIGFDVSHLDRLLKIYKNLRFDVNGEQERFAAFTYDGFNKGDMQIFVNPRIMYNGSDFNKVEVLGVFCK